MSPLKERRANVCPKMHTEGPDSHFFAHRRSPTPQRRRWGLASGGRSFHGHQRALSEQESRSGSGPQRNSSSSSSSTASTTGEDAGQLLDMFMTLLCCPGSDGVHQYHPGVIGSN